MDTTEQKAQNAPAPKRDASSRPPRAPRRGADRARGSFERPKPEFDQKILGIRRVTRVVSGGRRFSFAVAMAIGDRKGSVGVGTGKAGDTALAIGKALKDARKNMIKVPLTETQSIPFPVKVKYSSARIMLMPNRGRGLVAGSAVRDILFLAGIKDVTSKILSGSKNKLNNARAAVKALSLFVPRTSQPAIEPAAPNKEEASVGEDGE